MSEPAILCVDDEAIILESLREQLERAFGEKYIYEMAEGSEDAWEIIHELYSDGIRVLVIISDWLMPGVKGDDFLIEVYKKFPDIVTVLITGQADPVAVDRAFQGANLHACLRKPWSESELVNLINQALE